MYAWMLGYSDISKFGNEQSIYSMLLLGDVSFSTQTILPN